MNKPQTQKNSGRLTSGPIGSILFKMSVGLLGGHIAMVIFNSTDTYFVSQLGTNKLAAMAFTFPVVMVLMNTTFGLGIGTGALVSRSAGSGDEETVRRYTIHACILNFIIAIVLSQTCLYFRHSIFSLLGADQETVKLVNRYMVPWFLGFPLFAIPMTFNNSLRAIGDVKTPTLIMMSAAFMNLALDPILIFGLGPVPHLGLQGAAFATIGSRLFTVVAVVYIANKRLHLFGKGSHLHLSLFFKSTKNLLKIGIPAISSLLLFPVAINIVTRIIAINGNTAVAAYGAGGRIDMIAFLPIFALSNSLLPFYGQNLGAGYIDRIRKAHNNSIVFALFWGALMTLLYWSLRPVICDIFASDAETHAYMSSYIFWAPIGFFGANIIIMSFSELNGLHKPGYSTLMSVMRSMILMVLPAILGNYLYGAVGVFISIAVGTILGAGVSFFLVKYCINSLDKTNSVKNNMPV